MEAIFIILLALLLDLLLGDPPNALHPVAWMGKVITLLLKGSQKSSPRVQLFWGIMVTLLTMAIFVIPVYFLLDWLKGWNIIVFVIAAALLFKMTFSIKGLCQAALKIKKLLMGNDLQRARFEMRALVSRNTSQLTPGQMVSAAIESVGESSCDSFFAPLFYFVFLGVPGAFAYRVINTLDAMIGYHGQYEYIGKFAARLDTVVNFIPARLAALAIVAASWLCRSRSWKAWKIMRRDAVKTESPNAGWTMSAMSGALDVQLEKVGYYKLGDAEHALNISHIDKSLKIMVTACMLWFLLVIAGEVVYYVVR
jgi:adenosylcobinamide-phosphate synthase